MGVIALLAVLVVVASPSSFWTFVASSALILYVLVASFNLLTGYAGLLSLAHVAIFGAGAYVSVVVYLRFGASFWIGALCALVLGVALSLLLAYPTLRTGGLALGVATLAFGSGVEEVLSNWSDVTGGAQGLSGGPEPSILGLDFASASVEFLVLLSVVAFVTFVLTTRSMSGPVGHRFVSIRASERDAVQVGIGVGPVRAQAFAISGALAGVAGALYAVHLLVLSPEAFSLHYMIDTLIALMIGGAGTPFGPVIGVGVLVGLQEGGAAVGEAATLVLGIGIIVIITFAPEGVVGQVRDVAGRLWGLTGRRAALADGTDASAEGDRDRIAADRTTGAGSQKESTPAPVAVRGAHTPHRPGRSDVRAEAEDDSDAVLRVERLSVHFGGVKALEDVSLALARGQVLGLIGPNGSGKSTLVNAVTGVVPPTAGSVRVGGTVLTDLPPNRIPHTGVARTFQHTALIPDFPLVTNVAIAAQLRLEASWAEQMLHVGRSLRHTATARSEAMELLALLDVAQYAEDRPDEVAYGVLRRAEVARALMLRPKFLLLDEPGAGLDDFEREAIRDIVERIASEGVGVLLIDHNVQFVAGVADTIVVLNTGEVLASGDAEDILTDDRVVEAYLGTTAELR